MVEVPSGDWQKVNDSVIRLEETVKSFKHISAELRESVNKIIEKYEQLPCIEHREKIKSNRVWLRAIWIVLTGLAAIGTTALIKIAVDFKEVVLELSKNHP